MSPEEHTAAIRSLQADVAEIKAVLNNGLRTMVADHKAELVTVKADIQTIRDGIILDVREPFEGAVEIVRGRLEGEARRSG